MSTTAAANHGGRARALVIELDVPVAVASRDDLIAMKRASGRAIDRSDIIALTEP